MSKFYYIEPIGKRSPDLFQTFEKTFVEQGHEIVTDISQADVVFWDLFSGLGEFDKATLDECLIKNIPVVMFDETDYGGMSKEEWWGFKSLMSSWERRIRELYNNGSVYFMRKMDNNPAFPYPSNVYPYEKVLMNDFPLTTSQELNSRPNEIFFCGNTSPQRESVCNELSKHFKCDFSLGQQKIPHDEWLNRARQAKLFLTADGGGFSDERPYQLISIAGMLRQKNNHLQTHPFSDCINCLEVSENPTPEEIKGVRAVLDDPEYLFEIYEEGAKFAREYYSAEHRANYILSILKQEGMI